ncbi:hypothetical protein KY290_035428 [Solanum tuberosum]|uniref:Carbohydrate kinase PfkB domain-containing protein n=1 Tax=Solanum tuberosum TaxID=4113 RepID=A0ABQ7U9M5_SOLTU|nr:hypothetical protein KY289_034930 [Solanum tuberosum]KAH0742385.1 hypothetical protein KY290_035428 [Solanum tuberosum]
MSHSDNLHSFLFQVADDSQGKRILNELEADGIDTSFIVVSQPQKTRTSIYTPGYPPMVADDLPYSSLSSALDGARLVYTDGALHEVALIVAQEAHQRSIPIVIDAERKIEGLDELLHLATYIVCSTRFPQASYFFCRIVSQIWTEAPSLAGGLISILLKLPSAKFVIATLGEDGCIMLERAETGDIQPEVDIDGLFEKMKQSIDTTSTLLTFKTSDFIYVFGLTKCLELLFLYFISFKSQLFIWKCPFRMLQSCTRKGLGLCGRLLVGTAEKIPSLEIVDTTGAGDAFVGAVLYSLCANFPPEKMLMFASQVAAIGCRALGARAGLPHLTDPRLSPFLA